MLVQLLDHTHDPEDKIAAAAAICYGSDDSPEANYKRLKMLIEKEHLSPLRFAYATFKVSEISVVTAHQMSRTAHAGFLQQSHRYVSPQMQAALPPLIAETNDWQLRMEVQENIKKAASLYAQMIKAGIPKEDARFCLPLGIQTNLMMTGNFQMWYRFIKARQSRYAQWEIQAVAENIHYRLKQIAPNIF